MTALLSACLSLLLPSSQEEARAEVPDKETQEEARKLIHEIFAKDLAKRSPEDREALASKLLQQAKETEGDPTSRYVLLDEARDVALRCGHVPLLLQAVVEVTAGFQVDTVEFTKDALSEASKKIRSPEDCAILAEAYLSLIDLMLREDAHSQVGSALRTASSLARKAKSIALVTKVKKKGSEATARKKSFTRTQRARTAIAKNPDDPDANLTLGRYECFVKEKWEEGLPKLTKGSDKALRRCATLELAMPTALAEILAVGDGWWEVAEKEGERLRAGIRGHACRWYHKALPQLSGLTRAKVEKRITEVESARASAELAVQLAGAVDLLPQIDPKRDTVKGSWILEAGSLVSQEKHAPGGPARIQIPYHAPDEYDLIAVAEKKSGVGGLAFGLTVGDRKFCAVLDTKGCSGLALLGGRPAFGNETTWRGEAVPPDKKTTIVCSVRKDGVKISVDGKVIIEYRGDLTQLTLAANYYQVPDPKALLIASWESSYVVSQMALVAVSGRGKALR